VGALDAAPGWFAATGDRLKSLGGGDGGENNSDGGRPEPAAVVTGAAVAAAALRTKSKGEEEGESNRPSSADEDTSPPTDLLGLTRKLIAVRVQGRAVCLKQLLERSFCQSTCNHPVTIHKSS
jgi:hypothetical protein